MFVAFGIVFSLGLASATPSACPPAWGGYFSSILSVIHIVLGVVIALKAVSPRAEEHQVAKLSWSTIVLFLGSIVLYGLMLTRGDPQLANIGQLRLSISTRNVPLNEEHSSPS